MSGMTPTVIHAQARPCGLRVALGGTNGTRIISGLSNSHLKRCKIFLLKPWRVKCFFQSEIIINVLVHLNTYIMGLQFSSICLLLQRGGRLYTSESYVYRWQIFAYEDGPRTVRVKYSTLGTLI